MLFSACVFMCVLLLQSCVSFDDFHLYLCVCVFCVKVFVCVCVFVCACACERVYIRATAQDTALNEVAHADTRVV